MYVLHNKERGMRTELSKSDRRRNAREEKTEKTDAISLQKKNSCKCNCSLFIIYMEKTIRSVVIG